MKQFGVNLLTYSVAFAASMAVTVKVIDVMLEHTRCKSKFKYPLEVKVIKEEVPE